MAILSESESAQGGGRSGDIGLDQPGFNLQSEVEELKRSIGQIRTDVTQIIDQTMHLGKAGADIAGDALSRGIQGVKQKGAQSAQALQDGIAAHPLAGAAVGVAAGFVLARLLRRR